MKTFRTAMTALALTAIAGIAIAAGPEDGKGKEKRAEKANYNASHVEKATVGEKAPEFTLTDLSGTSHNLSDFAGKVVVLEWFNPQCPFVVKQYAKTSVMADTKAFASENGDVVWLTINSGAEGKQGAGLDLNKEYAADWGIENPILLDESGEVGRLYGAKTTPHMYVIDAEGVLQYAGAIDNDRSPNTAGDTNYVIDALKAVFAGETVETAETKPYGCSVKYSKG